MAINESRQAARLKISQALLAKDPENTALATRVYNQTRALEDQEAAYPKALLRHLRHCAQNGQADPKGRSKKIALDLLKGIKPAVKLGTGNG
jgi:hypothetical protein